ncbi:hypothetical protein DID88_004001 [Monilinia fructigena]|uniref:Uncharacterized protein n=1 Tax=Monilinia fructigena TaxID=38457 RepID=A0A395IGT7_9HELO|nr:hypothetical protein DID88_004001 [Monilinia fructigena]
MGESQSGDSWALKMVKMNTRHELHPFGEAPGPSGIETDPELRRVLQLSLEENAELQEKYNSALAIIERMQSNHKIELQQERDDLSATLQQRENQIQDKEWMLGLFREKVRCLSIKCDTQACCKPEHVTLMEQKEEVSKLLYLEKDRYEALHAKHASLDSIYQDTQGLLEEEQKKNVGLVSGHGKLTKEHQRLHSDHEELRALFKNQKPFVDVGVAIRLRWLENIPFYVCGPKW